MKKLIMTALVLVASASLFVASAADKSKGKNKKKVVAPIELKTSADSLSYAAGVNATRGLINYLQQAYQVDTAYMENFLRGYKDALAQGINPRTTAYSAGMEVAKLVEKRVYPGTKEELKGANDSISHALFQNGFMAALGNDTTFFTTKAAAEYQKEALAGAGEKFLAENAKKPGVKVLPSGLQYKVITEGHGEVPKASDEVEVIYEGRLINGTVFDSTAKHGNKTDKFKAGNLIKGWTEALTTMPVGSKWQLYIPQELAYGERQAGQIPPYSTLVFDLELVSIVPEAKPTEPAGELKDNVAVGSEKKTASKSTAKASAKKVSGKKGKK